MRPLYLLAALLLLPALCAAQPKGKPKPKKKEEVKMTDAGRKATARGLAWLAKQQNTDGSWSDGGYPHNPAISSFALLAFLSQGHLPNQGTYGKEIAKAARFLVSCARTDGYLIGTRGGNMYSHGMATLALAELWSLTSDKAIKPVLKKAVKVIENAQNAQGGWRYSPQPTGADISVTIMQVMALRAAKNCGLDVADQKMTKAIAYINSCHKSDGGYAYQPRGRSGFARTAAGVCVLQLTGKYNAKEIKKAVEYMKDNFNTRTHYWYGHYYASHAMHQIGGKEWKEWYAKMNKEFLPAQGANGSWSGRHSHSPGPVYQTAIAVIALSVPMNYLPIFQR